MSPDIEIVIDQGIPGVPALPENPTQIDLVLAVNGVLRRLGGQPFTLERQHACAATPVTIRASVQRLMRRAVRFWHGAATGDPGRRLR